jgi:hypothetical protein
MADVDIRVKAKDEASGILKSISQGILQGFGQAAFGAITNAIGGATQAMAGFVMEGISKASNLNESINKTNVVFGDAADAMIKWSESAATSIGMSQQSALDAAGGFAVFGKAAGLAGADVTKFAQEGLSRAADMASIFNTSVEDASLAMQAAFRGETEPIRKYGVMLDDATMRQKALALGIVSTTKEALTPQQKVLAANALIMESTAFTMGDFQNTADGMANSQRILTAQIENAQAQLGTMFLPIVTKVMGFLNTQGIPILKDMMKAFMDFAGPVLDTVGEAFEWFSGMVERGMSPLEAFGKVLKYYTGIDFSGLTSAFGDIVNVAQNIGKDFMDGFATGIDNGANPVRASIDGIANVFKGLGNNNVIFDTLGNIMFIIGDAIDNMRPGLVAFGNFWTQQGPTIQAIAGVMLAKFAEVAQWFANEIIPFLVLQFNKLGAWFQANGPLITKFGAVVAAVFGGILVVFQTLWVVLKPILAGFISGLLGFVKMIMQIFTGDFSGALATWKENYRNAFASLQQSFADLAAWVTGWFGTSWAEVGAQWNAFFAGLSAAVGAWWLSVTTGFVSFFDGIGKAISTWAANTKKIWTSNWNALKQIITTVTNMIMTTIINWLRSIITSIIGFAVDLYNSWKAGWDTLINAVINATAGIITAVANLITSVIAAITGKVNEFLAVGAAIVKAIQDGIIKAWDEFVTWIKKLLLDLITGLLPGGTTDQSFQDAGYNMMRSLAAGILQGAGLPRLALSAVSLNMDGMGGGGAYNSTGGMRTGNTYQRNNIYGPVTLQMNGGRGTELLKIK